MARTISSRTPEGVPNHCPVCDTVLCVEPSHPTGDAPCPNCGTLLWFFPTSEGMRCYESKAVAPLWDRLVQAISDHLRVGKERVTPETSFLQDIGADSLDIVELVMELEEETGITIPDDEAEHLKTVGDILDYLARRRL